jgi:putative hydrolase
MPVQNREIANKLQRAAELLALQGANPFRVSAYRRAAEMIQQLEQPLWQIYAREGIEGLDALPGIGRTIARAIEHLVQGERWPLLKRLEGDDVAERAFASVPNIGPKLAERIHDELDIETLAELHAAAWDGRLEKLPGFGEKRLRAVRESLATRGKFDRPQQRKTESSTIGGQTPSESDVINEVPVTEILSVDQEYRVRADADKLHRIAPRRFNPTGAAWLPVLHTQRGDRHYTALYSNTARAHLLGTTNDWVVIYLENHNPSGEHGRWTVITSQFGRLKGKRIVRGREEECSQHYENSLSP